ncbi:Elongin-C [Gracilaria domingensis]|nr:Elongin-C [Gracilaria domingensis]
MRQAFSFKPPVYSRDAASQTASQQSQHQHQKHALVRTLSARLTSASEVHRRGAAEKLRKLYLRRSDIVAEENTTHALHQHKNKQYLTLLHHHKRLTARQSALKQWALQNPPPPLRASIDDVTLPPTMLSEQSLKAKAADAALADALDQVDEAIDKGVIDTDTYMREVRKLARLQFFHRAMLRKIQVLLAATESHQERHSVMPNASPRLQRVPHAAFKI